MKTQLTKKIYEWGIIILGLPSLVIMAIYGTSAAHDYYRYNKYGKDIAPYVEEYYNPSDFDWSAAFLPEYAKFRQQGLSKDESRSRAYEITVKLQEEFEKNNQ